MRRREPGAVDVGEEMLRLQTSAMRAGTKRNDTAIGQIGCVMLSYFSQDWNIVCLAITYIL